jgi:phage terminase Nu1 subunit (DNA packaging protein)
MTELLSITDAAAVAGVSLRTMRRWVSRGQVVTVGRGRGRRVVASSLSKLGDNGDTECHEKQFRAELFLVARVTRSVPTVTSVPSVPVPR